jgi:hypothetical protein
MKFLILPLLLSMSLPALAGTHKVTYQIPVPEALDPFSRYDVEYTTTELANGQTELVYKLPKHLLGQDTEFRFIGQVDFAAPHFDLRGVNSEMRCEPGATKAVCKVGYSKVNVNLDNVRSALDEMPISPAEKAGRFEVAAMIARSGGDFAGILQLVREPEYNDCGK